MTAAPAVRTTIATVILFALPVFGKEPAPAAPDDTTIVLPELRTSPTFHCNYGFGIAVFGDKEAGTITHVFIDGVVEDSYAEKIGLKTGDEILSINGRKVTDLKGGTKVDGELFRLLIDRPPGEKANVEFLIRTIKKVELTAGIR